MRAVVEITFLFFVYSYSILWLSLEICEGQRGSVEENKYFSFQSQSVRTSDPWNTLRCGCYNDAVCCRRASFQGRDGGVGGCCINSFSFPALAIYAPLWRSQPSSEFWHTNTHHTWLRQLGCMEVVFTVCIIHAQTQTCAPCSSNAFSNFPILLSALRGCADFTASIMTIFSNYLVSTEPEGCWD